MRHGLKCRIITAFANSLVIRCPERAKIFENETVARYDIGIEEYKKRASATSLTR